MVSGWAVDKTTSIQQDPQMMTNSWEEGVLFPPYSNSNSYPDSDWLLLDQSCKGGNWTPEENKCFEKALAFFDRDTPDRWQRVAVMIPGKTPADVFSHYNDLEQDVRQIEEGLVPFPFPFDDWDCMTNGYCEGIDQPYHLVGGKRSASRPDHERKKGVPWTEEEHRLFLMGLKKYGKGDWRNISRNYVVSRTPTQVASHAQKYFIRLNSGSKDKRRSSIHDITTVNLPDNRPLSPPPPPPSGLTTAQSNTSAAASATPGNSDHFSVAAVDSNKNSDAACVYNSPPSAHCININQSFMHQPYGRMKLQSHQHLHGGALHSSMVAHHAMLYQMQTVQPHLHG